MKAVIAFLVVLLAQDAGKQKLPSPGDDNWPLGGVRLLPGYHYTPVPSDSCAFGTIAREDGKGVSIAHSAGSVANVVEEARRAENLAWEKKQQVSGWQAHVAMTKDSHLLISYGLVNFDAKVTSSEDVAEVLLMVLGFPTSELEVPKGR